MKNEFQNESLRQLLQAQKVQLIEKIKLERGGATSRSEAAVAELSSAEQSHAQNITERDNVFAMQEHDVAELEAIEQALARIAHGAYGKCQTVTWTLPLRVCWLHLLPCAALTAKLPQKKC